MSEPVRMPLSDYHSIFNLLYQDIPVARDLRLRPQTNRCVELRHRVNKLNT